MKTLTKTLSCILALSMLLCMLPVTALALDAPAWTGDGTADSPYLITSAEDLAALATSVNAGNAYAGKVFKLTANIDLENREWTPIGKSGKPFSGVFDGDGKTISNLLINQPGKSHMGLFGYTTNGEIKNFTLNHAEVTGYLNVGAVAGTPFTSRYTDISVTGLVQVNGFAYVGGALGKDAYANITNVDVTGDAGSHVIAESGNYRTYVGGLVGFMGEGSHTVSDCDVKIDVTGSTCDVGGILGILHYGNTMVRCTYEGSLTLTNPDADVGDEFGALVGTVHNGGNATTKIEDCTATVIKATSGSTDVTQTITPHGDFYVNPANAGGNTGNVTIEATVNETPVTVNNYVASVGADNYLSFQAAIAAAKDGDTVTLLKDAATKPVIIRSGITLDLGGKTLSISGTDASQFYGLAFINGTSELTNGTIIDTRSQNTTSGSWLAVLAQGCTLTTSDVTIQTYYPHNTTTYNYLLQASSGATLTVDDGTVLKDMRDGADEYETYGGVGITVLGNESTPTTAVVNQATVETMGFALAGNGSSHGTRITINEGAVLTSDTTAIYHPQDGEMTINGGTITGKHAAVELRAGTLEINDGKFTATADEYEEDKNGNGTTVSGAALVISQHTTKKDISVTINGGEFTGVYALSETDVQNSEQTQNVDIVAITDGVFNGSVEADDCEKFISGGAYSESVAEYVVDELNYEAHGDMYTYHKTYEEAAAAGDTVTKIHSTNPTPTPGDQYTVWFVNNGSPASYTGDAGDVITIPTPTRSGYYFLGWSDGRNMYQGGEHYTVTGNATLTAQWVSIPGVVVAGEVINGMASQVMSPFVDVTPMDYYFDAVNWAVNEGVTTGTGRLTFSPDDACTRAQAVTFLWRACGEPSADHSSAAAFTDVDTSAYYATAVAWAVENGITNGTSATTFSPDVSCTRAQIVTFLYRAMGKTVAGSASFTDVSANDYFAPAVAWASAYGVTGGTTPTTFSPAAICTRAQIVTFLYRACK